MLMNLQTFNTFRPKWACNDVTEIDTIKKADWSPSNFHRRYQIDARKGIYVKNGGALRRRFGVIQDLRQSVCMCGVGGGVGGRFSSPSQSLAG